MKLANAQTNMWKYVCICLDNGAFYKIFFCYFDFI